jgi:hypothetical protein
MGIHNLAKLIADQAPGAIKEGEMKNYFGRKIAIDAYVNYFYLIFEMFGVLIVVPCLSINSLLLFDKMERL